MVASSPGLRTDLLDGSVLVLAGAPEEAPLAAALVGLGARVAVLGGAEPDAVAAAAQGLLDEHGRLDTLVVDAAAMFAAVPPETSQPLRAALDGAWVLTRAVVTAAMIGRERGGKVVYLVPPPDAGCFARATADGLENLARTLSVEWARHQVRLTTLVPGARTSEAELHGLVAYLASPAGDYFSGTRLELGAVEVESRA